MYNLNLCAQIVKLKEIFFMKENIFSARVRKNISLTTLAKMTLEVIFVS